MYKNLMKNTFSTYYAGEVSKSLNAGKQPSEISIDMKLSTLKPLNANWMIQCFDKIRHNRAEIVRGWKDAGIVNAVQMMRDFNADTDTECD